VVWNGGDGIYSPSGFNWPEAKINMLTAYLVVGRMCRMVTAKNDTREKIIELATGLIETMGYSGFSYQDIADKLKIKKASIHYHFPAKEDLGVAVFQAFRKKVDDHILENDFEKATPTEKLTGYFLYHAQFTIDCNQISCIGAITSEWNVIPSKLREQIEEFNKWHVGFIMSILKEGIKKREFHSSGTLEEQALFVIATTKGALPMARETQSIDIYHGITKQLMKRLKC
jgi:TetR/AcrR family transcriptional repressor of nem operon